jgi:hypothetical protein
MKKWKGLEWGNVCRLGERMREKCVFRVRVRVYGSDVVVLCVFIRMVNGFPAF